MTRSRTYGVGYWLGQALVYLLLVGAAVAVSWVVLWLLLRLRGAL